jgi:hypothetical protein
MGRCAVVGSEGKVLGVVSVEVGGRIRERGISGKTGSRVIQKSGH